MRAMKFRPWFFCFVLCAACSSGSGSGADPAASGSPGASGSGAPAAAPAEDNAPEDPSVKLLSPGAEPRAKLRYQLAPGAAETITVEQSRSEAMVGQKPRTVPPTKLTVALAAKGKAASGDWDWSYEVKEATMGGDGKVAGASAAQINKELQKVIGLKGTFVVSDRGHVRKVDPVIPPGNDAVVAMVAPGLADNIQTGFVALPVAAVGAGAKWERSFSSRQAGITVNTVATYELVSVSGDEVKLKVTSKQDAGKQSMEIAPGQKIEVSGYKAESTGDITLNTKHLAPRSSKSETKGSMTMEGLGKAAKEVKLTILVDITGS